MHEDPARPERDLDLGSGTGGAEDGVQGSLAGLRLAPYAERVATVLTAAKPAVVCAGSA